MTIEFTQTDQEIENCYDVMSQLARTFRGKSSSLR